MKKRVYFAHPMNVYNTPLARTLLDAIARHFPDHEIVSPSDEVHAQRCREYKEADKNPMEYFEHELAPSCDIGVILPFKDGKIGAGVFLEAQVLDRLGRTVWETSLDGETFTLFDAQDDSRALTRERTRERIRDGQGNTLPF